MNLAKDKEETLMVNDEWFSNIVGGEDFDTILRNKFYKTMNYGETNFIC